MFVIVVASSANASIYIYIYTHTKGHVFVCNMLVVRHSQFYKLREEGVGVPYRQLLTSRY